MIIRATFQSLFVLALATGLSGARAQEAAAPSTEPAPRAASPAVVEPAIQQPALPKMIEPPILAAAVAATAAATRRYAKRQSTWFRNQTDWPSIADCNGIVAI